MAVTEIPLDWTNVAVSLCFVVVSILVSGILQLSLELELIIAAIRCLLQLSVLGVILKPVLDTESAYPIALMTLLQISVAVSELVFVRSKYHYAQMSITVLFSISISAVSITVLGNLFAIGSKPFYAPREFVPIFGMIVSNTMTSTAVALNSFTQAVTEKKEIIEMYLSFGANRWEASKPIVLDAIRIGLLPTISNMAIVGLVSIPGTMTGQILAGASVDNAVRYQEIVMFMIVSSSFIGVVSAVMLANLIIFDSHSRLRLDLLKKKKPFQWRLKF